MRVSCDTAVCKLQVVDHRHLLLCVLYTKNGGEHSGPAAVSQWIRNEALPVWLPFDHPSATKCRKMKGKAPWIPQNFTEALQAPAMG